MKIGFTGSRYFISAHQVDSLESVLKELMPIAEFHHGDCIVADSVAHVFADVMGITIIVHPPINDMYRAHNSGTTTTIMEPKPYLERNHDIVDAIDLLIACPKDGVERMRSGTWATVRYARTKGIPVAIIYPSGEVHKK